MFRRKTADIFPGTRRRWTGGRVCHNSGRITSGLSTIFLYYFIMPGAKLLALDVGMDDVDWTCDNR